MISAKPDFAGLNGAKGDFARDLFAFADERVGQGQQHEMLR